MQYDYHTEEVKQEEETGEIPTRTLLTQLKIEQIRASITKYIVLLCYFKFFQFGGVCLKLPRNVLISQHIRYLSNHCIRSGDWPCTI